MKKVSLKIDKHISRVKLHEEVSQEEVVDSDNFFDRVKNPKYIYCPYNFGQVCGSLCAWFDIEDRERLKLDPPKNPNGFSLEQFEVYRAVTCKGTPIGELVEEALEEYKKE